MRQCLIVIDQVPDDEIDTVHEMIADGPKGSIFAGLTGVTVLLYHGTMDVGYPAQTDYTE